MTLFKWRKKHIQEESKRNDLEVEEIIEPAEKAANNYAKEQRKIQELLSRDITYRISLAMGADRRMKQ